VAQSRLEQRPATVYISGRGGSGSHWLAEMLGDLGLFANAGEVSIPGLLAQEIEPWPLKEQGLFVDCVHLLHAWAGQPFPDESAPPVARRDIASLHVVNCNGDSKLLAAKQWEPDCVFIHLIRDPRDQVLSFTYRKPGARDNYPIEPLEEFLRWMLIFNRLSLSWILAAPVRPDVVCRYEDLRRDAASELRRIVDRVGVSVSEELIEEVAFRHSAKARRQGIGAPLGNLSPQTRSWRESATREERLLMHAGLAEVVDTYGYDPDECAGRPLDFIPLSSDFEITLPEGVVLGEIHIRRSAAAGWERAGHATGSFRLPAGAMVRLRAPGSWTIGLDLLVELLPARCLSSLCMAGNIDVTDADVGRLVAWSGLVELDLARTRVTDACIEKIAQMRELRHVSLVGTGVSAAALERLAAALPDCALSAGSLITDVIRGRGLFDEELITEPSR
jgi:hypothetical protein